MTQKIKYNFFKSIAVVFSMAMLFSCKDNYERVGEEALKTEFPQGIGSNFKMTYTETGEAVKNNVETPSKVVAVLTSPLSENFENSLFPRKTFPNGMQLDFYNDDGQKTVITADHCIMYSAVNLIDLQGNVVINNHDGKILKTPQLYMDRSTQWIFTQEKFEYTNPEEENIMYGTGFDCNQKIEKINAHKVWGYAMIPAENEEQ